MGDIPLYLSNVSVSIGQTVEVEQVGEALFIASVLVSVGSPRFAKALARMPPSFRLAARALSH